MSSYGKERPTPNSFMRIFTWVGFLMLYMPLVTLVSYSFLKPTYPGSYQVQWTLEWYQKLFSDRVILDALRLSVTIGLWSTLGATALGTAAALALTRFRFPGRNALEALTYVPLIMPEIILGISLLIWFVFLNITLGVVSITLAHITFSTSYVVITVKARLQGLDESLEEASRDLGANGWLTFLKVTLPLIWPGIFSGALMAFTLSFDDFLITYFTAGVDSDTLPLRIYTMTKFGVTPEINALSSLILGVTLACVLFFFKPFRKEVNGSAKEFAK